MKRFLRMTLALAGAALACASPTAPSVPLAACSLQLPSGYLCFQPCPPGTEHWASGTPLAYSPSLKC